MIGMKHHDPVHSLGEDRVNLVFLGRYGKAHAQEVRRIVERVLRVNERLPDRILVGHCGNRRQFGDHADRRNLTLPGIIDVKAVMVECRNTEYYHFSIKTRYK